MTAPDLETVLAWHEALNADEAGRLAALSHTDVELGGPRGPARGRQVLKEWVGRANIRLEPLRSFHRGRTVVVEEEATWRDARTGEKTAGATVATVFTVQDGLVASVVRHDDLGDALRAAGLEESDRVGQG